MTYATQDKETGTIIDEFATIAEARTAIAQYEIYDKNEGLYTPEFYEIMDLESESIVE